MLGVRDGQDVKLISLPPQNLDSRSIWGLPLLADLFSSQVRYNVLFVGKVS
jgi:hypothetical protein